ncbi:MULTISPECIES: DUF4230 domain-containing protein [Hymenobacter]|uniref:DUF4230 domain-containing protein n=1 Tax=Hymenobacter jejuensis TaxID=2502781 RepID=A0A5B8A0U5_9BACT|nr:MULTISPECIES: DUF4230 domain-containing protein [Hymenobacter]MBC6991427.1 DUF4230 domain-containing protein [Hymenobacter sp. BT491]QDA59762.1 DUF4230 domain-containing protein [Hymenobacter jejuensis]
MPVVRLLRRLLPLVFLVGLGWFLWKKVQPVLLDNPLNSDPRITVTHNTVLTKVEALGRMELVRYNFKDVVEYRKGTYRFLEDAKVALIVAGDAVGCLDLRKVRAQDVVFEGDSVVRIALPPAELCSWRIDHSQSKVYSVENGLLRNAELVDEAYKYAEKNVRRSALQSGILAQTQQNAQQILRPMLETMTGRRVVLVQQTAPPQVPGKR